LDGTPAPFRLPSPIRQVRELRKGDRMKRSEELLRMEIDMAIATAGRDTIANFELVKQSIQAITNEELDNYDVEKLRDGAAHLIDATELILLGVVQLDEPRMAQANEAIEAMRKELAAA
jgi:hypothetical protein